MAAGMAVRQGVVFRQNGHLRPRLAPKCGTKGGFQAPDGLLSGQAKGLQCSGKRFHGKVLLKAQFRMVMDLAADLDDAVGGRIDGLHNLLLRRHEHVLLDQQRSADGACV